VNAPDTEQHFKARDGTVYRKRERWEAWIDGRWQPAFPGEQEYIELILNPAAAIERFNRDDPPWPS
jgi:hypothetical protein